MSTHISAPSGFDLYEVTEWTRGSFHPGMSVIRTKTVWAYSRHAKGEILLGSYIPSKRVDIVVSSDRICTKLKDPATGVEHGPYPTSQIRALKVNFVKNRLLA